MLKNVKKIVFGYLNKKVKTTNGMIIAVAVASFVVGILTGTIAAKIAFSKKIKDLTSNDDDFDADEYVRNLNFEE